ncbi:MAG TPA: Rrf2 family transcriptional regulator [Candidatus Sulfotelmatobacter sp.]|nr:Rrf2 family transcriptional regulator [Candidatus Sulfotelmatobacter sp.]
MKADYGLRALLDLADHHGEGPVPCHDIAARQHIPGPFLDQLLMTLRRAGLVQSTRGPRGGHVLAQPPEEITLAHAVDILEGQAAPLAPDEDALRANFGPAIHAVLGRAEAAARAILEESTLADLLHVQHRERVFHGIFKPLGAA